MDPGGGPDSCGGAAGTYTHRMLRGAAVAASFLVGAPSAFAVEVVRIAVADAADSLVVSGPGLAVRRVRQRGRFEPVPAERARVLPSRDGLAVDGRPLDQPDVRFRARGMLRCAGERMRGEIEVRRTDRGLLAVNVLPLEEYLLAVLGGEMPPGFPEEALKAQAVASRTYAIRKKVDAAGRPYHLGAGVLHQVYGGAAHETSRTRAAVETTAGEVLAYAMEPIEAYFHSACGGQTESGADALARPLPYLSSVECPCAAIRRSAWTLALDGAAAAAAFGSAVANLDVVERTASGRARRVRLVLQDGRRSVAGTELRQLLGYDRLKSLAFEVRRDPSGPRLVGQGAGHGAGLCQWGARAFAEQGWDYRAILRHYYPGVEVRQMY